MNKLPLANYTQEQELFQNLLKADHEQNILMFQGESGSGKSHLIDHCIRTFESPTVAQMRLENSSDSIGTLFNIIGSKLGPNHLPIFNETLAGLIGERPEENESLWPIKLRRNLRELGKTADLETKLAHFQLITDSWFADISAVTEPILIAIDTYEKSSTEFDQWFSEEFLFGIAHAAHVKVLVGGQSLPDPIPEWQGNASIHRLSGVEDVHAWEIWGDELGLRLPSADVITGICLALQGNPSAIVETLKRQFDTSQEQKERPPASPSSPSMVAYQQRKLIRENLIDSFTLSELKDLCFDLALDFENFPDHDHKPGLARELVGFLGKDGRIDEFIDICKAERPEIEWVVTA